MEKNKIKKIKKVLKSLDKLTNQCYNKDTIKNTVREANSKRRKETKNDTERFLHSSNRNS